MIFIDTNYFLRFLINDVPDQAESVSDFFKDSLRDNTELFTSELVIFELCWVLQSSLGKKKSELIVILKKILDMSFIVLEKREYLQEALVLFADTTLEFEDCYNLAIAKHKKAKKFATFDKKLQKVIKRLGYFT